MGYHVARRKIKDPVTGKVKLTDSYYILGRENGIRLDKSLHTTVKKDAEEIAKSLFSEKVKGSYGIATIKKITLRDLMNLYITHCQTKNKVNTARKKRTNIKSILSFFSGDMLLSKITVETVERFKQERAREVSKSTVNHDLTLLKHSLRLAVQWGYLELSPARFIEKFEINNERTKFLSRKDFDKIVRNCTPELAFVVTIAVHTGMRLGELTGLDWNDIDLENRIIMVLETKNDEPRFIPINEELYPLLDGITDKNGKVITLSEKRIRTGFESAVKKAGIDRGEGLNKLVFHSLRHTCGSWLAMRGASTLAIATILGHKSLAMTKRYSKFSKSSLASVMELLTQN